MMGCMTVDELTIQTGCLEHCDEENNIHCVSKNDTDVAHYNFNAHQPILVIFGRDVAERACYQMAICYPTSPN